MEPFLVHAQPAIKVVESPPKPPRPPSHFGRPEKLLWARIFADYEITGAAALAVLSSGLEAHQRARLAREAIERDGMTITGRDGQIKPHPLLATERDARQAFLAAIKVLGLKL